MNRNPLEIVASSLRAGRAEEKLYLLALWERYLRQAVTQIEGLPVLVTRYDAILAGSLDWCERTRLFLDSAGLGVIRPSAEEVLTFVDTGLRHGESTRDEFLADVDVSPSQRELFLLLEGTEGRIGASMYPTSPARRRRPTRYSPSGGACCSSTGPLRTNVARAYGIGLAALSATEPVSSPESPTVAAFRRRTRISALVALRETGTRQTRTAAVTKS